MSAPRRGVLVCALMLTRPVGRSEERSCRST